MYEEPEEEGDESDGDYAAAAINNIPERKLVAADSEKLITDCCCWGRPGAYGVLCCAVLCHAAECCLAGAAADSWNLATTCMAQRWTGHTYVHACCRRHSPPTFLAHSPLPHTTYTPHTPWHTPLTHTPVTPHTYVTRLSHTPYTPRAVSGLGHHVSLLGYSEPVQGQSQVHGGLTTPHWSLQAQLRPVQTQ